MKNILTWIILFIWLLVIFIFSNMSAIESSNKSKSLLTSSIVITNKITSNNQTTENTKNLINKLHTPFRKLMHVFEYFILSIILLIALSNTKANKTYIITIILCVLYAISDEYHQSMVLGRCARGLDVLIDSIGIFIGCLIYYTSTHIKSLHKY
jgi:VanZ family protein